jgi:secondary thiamine-phosphate synthase enzyme
MKIVAKGVNLQTKGRDQVLNITDQVSGFIDSSGIKNGNVTVFVSGSTGSVTTIEYEPGLIKDMKKLGERIAPSSENYAHNETWGDGNGYSHVRSAVIGPSLVVPIVSGKMVLGTWQQIAVIDHDTRSRSREIVIQIMGE